MPATTSKDITSKILSKNNNEDLVIPRTTSISARIIKGFRPNSKVLFNYILIKTIGKGNFAKVKLAKHKISQTQVAIKIIDKTKISEENLLKLFREVSLIKQLNHPNIVRLYEVLQTESTLYLVMEYASGGELYDYLVKRGRMNEDQARDKFRQIISAIQYCHSCSIVHRDLKAENVLLDEHMNVKIADFGFGNYYDTNSKLSTFCGSPPYAAPELFLGDPYIGPEVDIWSCGVILFTLVTGTMPFDGSDLKELRQQVLKCRYRVPFYLSSECEMLLKKMLVREPAKRKPLDVIMKDRWINTGYQADARMQPLFFQKEKFDDRERIQQLVDLGIEYDIIKHTMSIKEYNHIMATYLLLDRHPWPGNLVNTGEVKDYYSESVNEKARHDETFRARQNSSMTATELRKSTNLDKFNGSITEHPDEQTKSSSNAVFNDNKNDKKQPNSSVGEFTFTRTNTYNYYKQYKKNNSKNMYKHAVNGNESPANSAELCPTGGANSDGGKSQNSKTKKMNMALRKSDDNFLRVDNLITFQSLCSEYADSTNVEAQQELELRSRLDDNQLNWNTLKRRSVSNNLVPGNKGSVDATVAHNLLDSKKANMDLQTRSDSKAFHSDTNCAAEFEQSKEKSTTKKEAEKVLVTLESAKDDQFPSLGSVSLNDVTTTNTSVACDSQNANYSRVRNVESTATDNNADILKNKNKKKRLAESASAAPEKDMELLQNSTDPVIKQEHDEDEDEKGRKKSNLASKKSVYLLKKFKHAFTPKKVNKTGASKVEGIEDEDDKDNKFLFDDIINAHMKLEECLRVLKVKYEEQAPGSFMCTLDALSKSMMGMANDENAYNGEKLKMKGSENLEMKKAKASFSRKKKDYYTPRDDRALMTDGQVEFSVEIFRHRSRGHFKLKVKNIMGNVNVSQFFKNKLVKEMNERLSKKN